MDQMVGCSTQEMLAMQLSQSGLMYLCAREAFRAKPYKDGSCYPNGQPRWAIGYGHTILQGAETQWGGITRVQASTLLAHDLEPREAELSRLVSVSLTQHQYDALVSLIFNIGTAAFGGSTLLRLLNAGDYTGAAAEFGKWNKWRRRPGAPLEVSDGLTLRRKLDRELFETPDDVPLDELLERAMQSQFDLAELVDVTPHAQPA